MVGPVGVRSDESNESNEVEATAELREADEADEAGEADASGAGDRSAVASAVAVVPEAGSEVSAAVAAGESEARASGTVASAPFFRSFRAARDRPNAFRSRLRMPMGEVLHMYRVR
jgi:hypothetical protein